MKDCEQESEVVGSDFRIRMLVPAGREVAREGCGGGEWGGNQIVVTVTGKKVIR